MGMPIKSLLMKQGGGGGTDPDATAIIGKLSAWWELNESSGTRNDSVGTAHMTATGSGTSTANGVRGVGDVAVSFNGSGNLAASGADAAIQIPASSGNWAVFGWFYVSAFSGNQFFISKWSGVVPGTLEYSINTQAATLFGQSGGTGYVNASTPPPSAGAWHFYVVWKDTDNKVRLSIDDGTVFASAGTTNAVPGAIGLNIGAAGNNSLRMTGRAQRCGFVKGGILTSSERTYLYNAGSSRTYAELLAAS